MSVKCHNPTWHLPFFSCQRLRNFAGIVDEKLDDRAERAILQGDNSIWHAGVLQLDRQDLDLCELRKSQF